MSATAQNGKNPVVHLHPLDTVCIALGPLEKGTRINVAGQSVALSSAIAAGHKIALLGIAKGEPITRYGQTIGFATQRVQPGDWVHSHNLAAEEFEREYRYASEIPPDPTPLEGRTFMGYRRHDGRVGTRNYLAVISTVNCSASVSKYVAERFDSSLLAQYSNIDGIVALTHKGGCAMQFAGEDHQQLNRVLSGFARHPNVAAYLLIGLGCETGGLTYLVENSGLVQLESQGQKAGPMALTVQQTGGTTKTVEAGIAQLAAVLPKVNDVRREPVAAGQLILGLQCGGSDGNSGISANPALGVACDMLVAAGGTVVLGETPEIYGAEHLLVRRAKTPEIGRQLVQRIEWWKEYTGRYGVCLDNNPSPGNKQGGLTTIYEKSLGAVAKAGSTALAGVYLYAEPIGGKGFVVMDSPGYDPASITGMVAGGANLVAFTTGRGSCYGCKPVPSFKIATNTPMYQRMIDDMDFDAGTVLSGTPLREVGRQIFENLLEVASGRKTKSELHGVGEEEFAPWSIGPTL